MASNNIIITLKLDTSDFKKKLDEIKSNIKSAVGDMTGEEVSITADASQAKEETEEVAGAVKSIPDSESSITADGSQAEEEAEETGDAIESIPDEKHTDITSDGGSALRTVAELSLAYQGLLTIISQVKGAISELIDLSNVQEKAENDLANAMKLRGEYTQSSIEQMKGYASAIQNVTIIGDEESIQLLTLATNMGIVYEERKKAVEGAIGLAKAYEKAGLSQELAMKGIALAYQGEYTQLQRYIPALRSASDDTEKMAILQKEMANGFELAKGEAETGAGAMQQFSNLLGDLKEKIGDTIKIALLPLVKALSEILKVLNDHPAIIKAAVVAFGTLAVILVTMKVKQIALNTAIAIGHALTGNWVAIAAAAAAGAGIFAAQTLLLKDSQEELNEEIKKSNTALTVYKNRISTLSHTELTDELNTLNNNLQQYRKLLEEATLPLDISLLEELIGDTEARIKYINALLDESYEQRMKDLNDYYNTVKFEAIEYYSWKTEQIIKDTEAMQISADKKRIIQRKLLADLKEEYSAYMISLMREKREKPVPVLITPEIEEEPAQVAQKMFGDIDVGEITFFDEIAAKFFQIQESAQEWADNTYNMLSEWSDKVNDAVTNVGNVFDAHYKYRKQLLENEMNDEIRAVEQSTLSEEEKQAKIDNIKEKYRKKELQAAAAMKPVQIAQAISGTALAVVNALQTKPFIPLGLIAAAAAAAEGAIQVTTIKAQKYAQGIINIHGPGTEDSDSILAFLSRGESVITADATKKNLQALSYVNAGGMIPGFAGGYVPVNPASPEIYDFTKLEEKLDILKDTILEAQPIIHAETIDPVKVSRLADKGKFQRHTIDMQG